MPKQKRASAAYCARQAKKRKQSQREDPVQRQIEKEQHLRSHPSSEWSSEDRRRIRNAEAHRSTRFDPEKRQQEQQRNTAARRQLRLDYPERRQEEQVCN